MLRKLVFTGLAAAAIGLSGLALPAAASAHTVTHHPQGTWCQPANKHDHGKNKTACCQFPQKGHDNKGQDCKLPGNKNGNGKGDQNGHGNHQGNGQGQGQQGNWGGQGGGWGGNGQGGNGCKPVTFTVSSTGTDTVTEGTGGPALTNGEEVVYNGVSPAQDYTVTDLGTSGGKTTFELEGPLPATTVHLEGNNSAWSLITVCPGGGGQGNGSHNHQH